MGSHHARWQRGIPQLFTSRGAAAGLTGRLLGLDRAVYARLAQNSVDSSFAPDALKAELRVAIREWAARA